MRRRELWVGALVLVAVALPFLGFALNQVLAVRRQQMSPTYRLERQLRNRFLSIKPKEGKVLMVPGPSLKGLSVNPDFYTLSLAKNGYWKKPMVVGTGFRFGYFNGAKYYEYQIAEIRPEGITLFYKESGMPVGVSKLNLNVEWK